MITNRKETCRCGANTYKITRVIPRPHSRKEDVIIECKKCQHRSLVGWKSLKGVPHAVKSALSV